VQQGISEKVALVANLLGAFACGYALAYARSWRLALAMTSVVPCITITGAVMSKLLSTYTRSVACSSDLYAFFLILILLASL
jgi:ATP-binding cassette subfamily B (MDR/TAP) protein 1